MIPSLWRPWASALHLRLHCECHTLLFVETKECGFERATEARSRRVPSSTFSLALCDELRGVRRRPDGQMVSPPRWTACGEPPDHILTRGERSVSEDTFKRNGAPEAEWVGCDQKAVEILEIHISPDSGEERDYFLHKPPHSCNREVSLRLAERFQWLKRSLMNCWKMN